MSGINEVLPSNPMLAEMVREGRLFGSDGNEDTVYTYVYCSMPLFTIHIQNGQKTNKSCTFDDKQPFQPLGVVFFKHLEDL
jgi:hypothetical protein